MTVDQADRLRAGRHVRRLRRRVLRHAQAFISPESFTFIESAIVLAIVVLGGLGSQLGIALAALVMIGGFELFRDLSEYRMLVFGVALVVIMVLRPRGLVVRPHADASRLGAPRRSAPSWWREGRATRRRCCEVART